MLTTLRFLFGWYIGHILYKTIANQHRSTGSDYKPDFGNTEFDHSDPFFDGCHHDD